MLLENYLEPPNIPLIDYLNFEAIHVQQKIPFALKIAYTAFLAVLVPSYWASYGPTNFLYFCDVALFVTLIAIWKENVLLASAAAVGILVPQILWIVDFSARFFDLAPTGMTAYMFDSNIALFYRGLSTFHGWLPILLLYLVYSLGYNKRALWLWTATAEVLLLVCYFFMPAPPGAERIPGAANPPVNINYVFGLSDQAVQTMMPELAWLAYRSSFFGRLIWY